MYTKTKLKDYPNAQERRLFLEKTLGINLSGLEKFSFAEEAVHNKNIENLVGATQVPLGIAGPILINGEYTKGGFYLPLATTEGALVASVSRGCKAVTLSGGVTVTVENVGVTRAPVFKTKGILESKQLIAWVEHNFSGLQKIAESTSSHLKLLNPSQSSGQALKSYVAGNYVWLRFAFDTSDAMGMNMVTVASDKLADFIVKKTGVRCLALSGNMCVDKKPSALNFVEGRGKKVWAEATIKKEIVKEVLKTTPKIIKEVTQSKIYLGSLLSGSLGFNAQFGNVIAGMFCATGQDLGHVTEGSLGITTTEIVGEDLYIGVYLPDLMLGTVGGGTGLPTQKESLGILGIPDPKLKSGQQVLKLAEIVGAAVLAGELSLLSALGAGDLAKAHEKLGRGKSSTQMQTNDKRI